MNLDQTECKKKAKDTGSRNPSNPLQLNLKYLVLLAGIAAMGGLLFGFDIAIITGAGPFIEKHFNLDKLELGWGFSSLLFGCILGSVFTGRITDYFGRKKLLFIIAVLFALTSLATGLSPTFNLFVTARFSGGLAVGAASVLSPLYLSEVAPFSIRGRLVTLYQLSIVFGILISYLINYSLHDIGDNNWRWMFITGIIPATLLFLLLFFVPETPRYLYKTGKRSLAFEILLKIGGKKNAAYEFTQIEASLAETKSDFRELYKPGMIRVMVVGIILAILIQISGINAIIDYAPIILGTAGWEIDAALFATFGLGIVNVIFTLVSIYAIDRFGRKPLYIIGSAGMTISMLLFGVLSFINHFEGSFVLILCILYLAFFCSCIGPVFWTLISEIYPTKIRGTAMSVPVFIQWLFNALVVLFFPHFLDILRTWTFGFIALMAFLQMLFAWKYIPETKGKTLEEIEKFWEI